MTPYVSNALGSYSSNAYTVSSQKQEEAESASKTTDTANKSDESQKGSDGSSVANRVAELLKEMPKDAFGRMSFEEISKYRKQVEEQFDSEIRAELKELGVDVDSKFQLIYDESTQRVVVGNDHPDKDKIEAYFADNPNRVKQFNTIMDLYEVEQLSQNRMNPQQLRQKLNTQSMAFWMQQNGGNDMFTGIQGIMFDAQNSYMRALNMKV
ncbi:hypothetical protein [Desulfovibrio oxyclinae]|uniref:hypothetical protein n=1 Tax=Desulfovibrio oxyclinae TaxID=63560 RepID=UPI0003664637|nr:hypothetical protein [Desulfovibrio oxyclinae]